MQKLPITYRASIVPRRSVTAITGPPGDYETAVADAHCLEREHNAKTIIIEKTDPYPINEGKWFLCHILK